MPTPAVRRRRERELEGLRYPLLRRLPLLGFTLVIGLPFGVSMTLTGLLRGRMLALAFGVGWLAIATVFAWSLLRDLAHDLRHRRRLRSDPRLAPKDGCTGSDVGVPLESNPYTS